MAAPAGAEPPEIPPEEGAAGPPPGIALQPGERVLWNGRPDLGMPRDEVRPLLRRAATGALALLLLWGLCLAPGVPRANGPTDLAVLGGLAVALAVVPAALVAGAVALCRAIGGAYVSIGLALLLVAVLGFPWVVELADGGLSSANQLFTSPLFSALTALLAVCGVRAVWTLLGLRRARYCVTSQRVLELRAGRTVWSEALPDGPGELRLLRASGARRRGHIAVGRGPELRLLRNVAHPEQVLERIGATAPAQGTAPGRRLPMAGEGAATAETDA